MHALTPTPFHRSLRDVLAREEPDLVRWYSSDRYERDRAERMRLDLLRSSYRLTAESHERVHRIAREAAERLGVVVPISLYQLYAGHRANAGLFFTAPEAHIALSGPLLASLDDGELRALAGHELAHHLLWTIDGGAFRIASELVESCGAEAGASPAFVESALRNRRWTEVFADRGAAIAAGGIEPAVACLVKVETGLAEVSARDYLAQAREVRGALDRNAAAETHPETIVRALALDLWHELGAGADREIAALVEGPFALESLDVVQQRSLGAATRALLDRLLAPDWMRTERTLSHARTFFSDYAPSAAGEIAIDEAAHEYFAYVLLDFAAVDPDLGDAAMARALFVARELGLRTTLADLLKKELKMSAAAIAEIDDKSPTIFERASMPAEESAE
jgi:Zn-dependent protease with chaperone function